jgi:hypothetical protein
MDTASEAPMIVKCKETYLDTRRIIAGTTAEVVQQIGGIRLRIQHAAFEGSEVHLGEAINVAQADFERLWEEMPQPSVSWDDDRGKMRQRHPADPDTGP